MAAVTGSFRPQQIPQPKSMTVPGPVVFLGIVPAIPKTFFDFLVSKEIIDPKTGMIREERLLADLPFLDNVSRTNVSNYIHSPLIQGRNLSLVMILSEIREFCRVSRLPMRTCMVGSACYYFLEPYIPIVMRRCFQIERGQYEKFLDPSRNPPADVDFRIDLPGATEGQLVGLANLMIQFVAYRLGVTPEYARENYVYNFKYIGKKPLSYFILSFDFPGNPNHKVDFSFVSHNPRTHLFTDQNFNIQFDFYTFRPDKVIGSIQAIIDRLDGIVHIENPEEVNFLGWFTLLSSWTKGRRSLSFSEGMEIWKTVDHGDWKKIASRLRNTAINHHPNNDSDALVTLAVNACSFFRQHENESEGQEFISGLMSAVKSIETVSFEAPFEPQDPRLKAILEAARSDIPFSIEYDILLLNAVASLGQDTEIASVDERPVLIMKTGSSCHLHLDARMRGNSFENQLNYYQGLEGDKQNAFGAAAYDFQEKMYLSQKTLTTAKEIEPFLKKMIDHAESMRGKELPLFLQMQIFEVYLLDYARAPSQHKLILILKSLHSLMNELSERKPMLQQIFLWAQKAIEEGEKTKEKRKIPVHLRQIPLDSTPSERQLGFVRTLLQSEEEPIRILSSEFCLKLPMESACLLFPEYLKSDFRLAMHIFAQVSNDPDSPLTDPLLQLYEKTIQHVMEREDGHFSGTEEASEYLALSQLVSITERIGRTSRNYLDKIDPKFLIWLSQKGYQKEAFVALEVMQEEGKITPEAAMTFAPFWIRIAKAAMDEGRMQDASKVFRMWYSFRAQPCWPCHPNCTFTEKSKSVFLDLFFALYENGLCEELFDELIQNQTVLHLVTALNYPITPKNMEFLTKAYSVGIANLGISSTWQEDYQRLKAVQLSESSALSLEISYHCRCMEENAPVEFSKVSESLLKAPPEETKTYLKQVIVSLMKNQSQPRLDLIEKVLTRFHEEFDDELLGMLWEGTKIGIGNKKYEPVFSRLISAALTRQSVFAMFVETFTSGRVPRSKGLQLFAPSLSPVERQALFQEVLGNLFRDSRKESGLVIGVIVNRFQEEFSEDTLLFLQRELKRELKVKKEELLPVFDELLVRFVSTPTLFVETMVGFIEEEFSSQPKVTEKLCSSWTFVDPLQKMQAERAVTIEKVLRPFFQDLSKERCEIAEKIVTEFPDALDPEFLSYLMKEIRNGMQVKNKEKFYLQALHFMMPRFLSCDALFVEAFVSFTERDFPFQTKIQEILTKSHESLPKANRDENTGIVLKVFSKSLSKERLDLTGMFLKSISSFPSGLLSSLLQQIKVGMKDKKESKNSNAFFSLIVPLLLSSPEVFVDAALVLTDKDTSFQHKPRESSALASRIVDSLKRIEKAPILSELVQKFLENPTKERLEIAEKILGTFQGDLSEETLCYLLPMIQSGLQEKKGDQFYNNIFVMLLPRFLDTSSLFSSTLELLTLISDEQMRDPKIKNALLSREKIVRDRLVKEKSIDRLTGLLEMGLLTYQILDEMSVEVLRQVFTSAQTKGYLSLACFLDAKLSSEGNQKEEERFAFAKMLIQKEKVAYSGTIVSIFMGGIDTWKYRDTVDEYCRYLLSLPLELDLKGEHTKYHQTSRSQKSIPETAFDLMEKYSLYSHDTLHLFYRHGNMPKNAEVAKRAKPILVGIETTVDPNFYSTPASYLEALTFFGNGCDPQVLQNWFEDPSFERRIQGSCGIETWDRMLIALRSLPCTFERYKRLKTGALLLPVEYRMRADVQVLSLAMTNESLQADVCRKLDDLFKEGVFESKKMPGDLLEVAAACFKEEAIRMNWEKWKSVYVQIFQNMLQNWKELKKSAWSEYIAIYPTLGQDMDDSIAEMWLNVRVLKWLEDFSDKRKSFHPFSMLLELLLERTSLTKEAEKFIRIVKLLDSSTYITKEERSSLCIKYIENQIIPYVQGCKSVLDSKDEYLAQGFAFLSHIVSTEERSRVATCLADTIIDTECVDMDLFLRVRQCTSQLYGKEIDFKSIFIDMPESDSERLIPFMLNPKQKDLALFYTVAKHIVERLTREETTGNSRADVLSVIVFTLYGRLCNAFPIKYAELCNLGEEILYNTHSMEDEPAFKVLMFGILSLREVVETITKSTSGATKKSWALLAIKLNLVERIFWIVKLGNQNRVPLDIKEYEPNKGHILPILGDLILSPHVRHITIASSFIGITMELYRRENRKIPEELILKVRDIMMHIPYVNSFVLMEGPPEKPPVPFIQAVVHSLTLPSTASEEHSKKSIIQTCNATAATLMELNRLPIPDNLNEKKRILGMVHGWLDGILQVSSSRIDSDTFYKAFIPCIEQALLFFNKNCSNDWDLRLLRIFKNLSTFVYMQTVPGFSERELSEPVRVRYENLVAQFKDFFLSYVLKHSDKMELTQDFYGDPVEDEKFPPILLTLNEVERQEFIFMFMNGKIHPFIQPTGKALLKYQGPYMLYQTPQMGIAQEPVPIQMNLINILSQTLDNY